jgi:hypothetical protein
VGYNVYRATLPGTAYSKITSALVTGTNYIDRSVAAGESYTYEVTVVNTAGEESARSTPASAVIP